MSTLLLKLQGNKTLNRTIWPATIHVYDDLIIYSKRSWFVVKEVTISYNQIAQIILNKGILFATIELETPSPENIIVKWLPRTAAITAKKIIDQKIYHSHAKHNPDAGHDKSGLKTYEKSLSRLKELVAKGQMTEKEYEKKKDALMREL